MAASPTTTTTSGGNALAALLAAAAASMPRQQQKQQQQTIHTNLNNLVAAKNVHPQMIANQCISGTTSYSSKNDGNKVKRTNNDLSAREGGNREQAVRQELEAKREALCQLLNLKPASLIESSGAHDRSSDNAPPTKNYNTPLRSNKRSTSSSPSSIHQLLSSSNTKSKQSHQNNQEFQQRNNVHKLESRSNLVDGQINVKKLNGAFKIQSLSNLINNINSNSCSSKESTSRFTKKHATMKIAEPDTDNAGSINTANSSRIKTNHKSSTSSSSSASTSDKDSNHAAKVLAGLFNGVTKKQSETDHIELRNLESWHDDDEDQMDDSCYQELVDPSNSNGWSADEMFKYNERMHKITSSYNERTLADNYTTPLPKTNSKATMRMATQLAKEIEEKVNAEGRVTPESSDDDEIYENERIHKLQLKQQRQLNQLKNLQNHSQHRFTMINGGSHVNSSTTTTTKTYKSSSQFSNSTETPATVSLSSSPTLNDIIIKPVTSSSRNILRTCLI